MDYCVRHVSDHRPRLRRGALLLLAALAGSCARHVSESPSTRCPGGQCDWTSVSGVVDSALRANAAPGAVVGVSIRGSRWYYGAGHLGIGAPQTPTPTTVYDMASLTKVIALTTLAMIAVEEHRLDLDAPVARYLPAFQGRLKDRVTIRHLLTHSSGLPADRPLWRETPNADSAVALVLATPLDTIPGARMVYSDLGAITLGKVIERIYGDRLDRLAEAKVFRPLGMSSTRYLPPASWLDRIAPTEQDPWRQRMIRGEVHDEKAAWLGGVAGHAGLFSDAVDLLTFGQWLLSLAGTDRSPSTKLPISAATVHEFIRRQDLVPGSSRALGWDTPSPHSSAGTVLSPLSFGHTGFTGTSIWIDPTRDLVIVLLSNRVHPTRDNPRFGPLRALVADRVATLVDRSR